MNDSGDSFGKDFVGAITDQFTMRAIQDAAELLRENNVPPLHRRSGDYYVCHVHPNTVRLIEAIRIEHGRPHHVPKQVRRMQRALARDFYAGLERWARA